MSHPYVDYISGADFISSVVKLSTYILCLALIWAAKKAGRVAPPIQFLFWLLLVICQGFTFGSVINHDLPGLSWSKPNEIIVVLSWALIFLNFVAYCFPDSPPLYVDLKGKLNNQDFCRSKKSPMYKPICYCFDYCHCCQRFQIEVA